MSGSASRRQVLAGGGALLLTGCLPGDDRSAPNRPDPDRRIRRRAADDVATITAAYASALARFPGSDELAAFAAEHRQHLDALRGPGPRPSPTASPSRSVQPPPDFVVPPTLRSGRRALADLEAAAADRRTRDSADASPVLARLFASIAGCNAAHAALLTAPRRGSR